MRNMIVGLIVSLACNAWAGKQFVIHSAPPRLDNGFISDGSYPQFVGARFETGIEPVEITRLGWFGVYLGNGSPKDNFTVSIYKAHSGEFVCTVDIKGKVDRELLPPPPPGTPNFGPAYYYEMKAHSITLEPETEYIVEIANHSPAGVFWIWLVSEGEPSYFDDWMYLRPSESEPWVQQRMASMSLIVVGR